VHFVLSNRLTKTDRPAHLLKANASRYRFDFCHLTKRVTQNLRYSEFG